jgi:phasin family protein
MLHRKKCCDAALTRRRLMSGGVKDFVTEQVRNMAQRGEDLRKAPVAAARKAAVRSAERIRSMNDPVRKFARTSVKLTSISQNTAKSLIELQSEIVTSALTEAAAQLQRIAYAEGVRELVREQADVLKSTRERIVNDISRAVTILKGAGGDARKAATAAYGKAARSGSAAPAARKRRTTAKAKRKTSKKRRSRKA